MKPEEIAKKLRGLAKEVHAVPIVPTHRQIHSMLIELAAEIEAKPEQPEREMVVCLERTTPLSAPEEEPPCVEWTDGLRRYMVGYDPATDTHYISGTNTTYPNRAAASKALNALGVASNWTPSLPNGWAIRWRDGHGVRHYVGGKGSAWHWDYVIMHNSHAEAQADLDKQAVKNDWVIDGVVRVEG
jgi:hypothetical protein